MTDRKRKSSHDEDSAKLRGLSPALFDYVTQVGAERCNFRRFVVRLSDDVPDDGGYRKTKEVGVIRVDAKGVVTTFGDVEPPSENDRTLIAAQIAAAGSKWPQYVPIGGFSSLPEELKKADNRDVFVFRDVAGEKILMIQQRITKADGSKDYRPWTHWSDGRWRCMEPDDTDGLPMWGLDQLRRNNIATIFVHEGAKAAHAMRELCEARTPEMKAALDAHPWGVELSGPGVAHVGWIGGAGNAGRTNWKPLLSLSPFDQIVIVADNDRAGTDAVPVISKIFTGRSLRMIQFDKRWPDHFDLADPWPRTEDFQRGENYIGPRMRDVMFPATFATHAIITPKGKRGIQTTHKITEAFAREWIWTGIPYRFTNTARPNQFLDEEEFNRDVRPFSRVRNTAELLIQSSLATKVHGVTYVPRRSDAEEQTIITENNQRLLNTFKPSPIRPIAGDATPFLEYMAHLIPDADERRQLLRFCATLISRPDIRMGFGVLLISETQGVGKSTLGENILAPILGPWNVSQPQEDEILGKFKTWIVHKQLVVVGEIYAGHSWKAYNALKSLITQKDIDVEEKYVKSHKVRNHAHFVISSNSRKAMRIDNKDRRWFVPRVTETLRPLQYWTEFNLWLQTDGLGHIAAWADEFLRNEQPFAGGLHAPETALKREMAIASLKEPVRMAFDIASEIVSWENQRQVILVVRDVRQFVANHFNLDWANTAKLGDLADISKALRDGGMKERPAEKDRRLKIGGNREEVVSRYPIPADVKWAEIKEARMTLEELGRLFSEPEI
jgi:hypothetical protein